MAVSNPNVPPIQSPWVRQFTDIHQLIIRITATFNNNTRALTGVTVFRDVGCLITTIYIGLGSDGTPNSSPYQFQVPEGTTTVTPAQLSSLGLNVIEDITKLQIAAS